MPINPTKVHSALETTTKLLLDQGLTGEEYLLVLQTLVAHALAANPPSIKKIFLLNLNADVLARRKAQLKQAGGVQ